MLDIILWIAAVALFLGTGVRWIFLPVAESWPAWLGFVIGAFAGASHSGGSVSILVVSGLTLAAVAHLANGYRLAVKYGLTGRLASEEDAEVLRAFRASGMDGDVHVPGSVEQSKTLRSPAIPSQADQRLAGRLGDSVNRSVLRSVERRGTRTSEPANPGATKPEAAARTSPPASAKVDPIPLFDVPGAPPSSAFVECWQAAWQHLNSMVQDGIQAWTKGAPTPPFREHLSFRLGNQLFLVRVEDVAGQVPEPSTRDGLLAAADDFGGRPCIMPMARARDGRWWPTQPGWGLVSARDGQPIDPLELVSDEEIEMTSWELHQFAVQVVERQIEDAGIKIRSSQGNLGIDPSIWIEGDSGPEWVVVRAAIYPAQRADIPAHWGSIVERCRSVARRGHFASVAVARAAGNFQNGDPSPGRLLRGHGMYVRYTGLEDVALAANRPPAIEGYGSADASASTAKLRSTARLAAGARPNLPPAEGASVRPPRVEDARPGRRYRAVLVVVENWPDGTMSMKFGQAMRDALMVSDDRIQLVQMSPERIFRAVTNVTEHEFRASLSASGVSLPKQIGFVEL